VASGADRQSCSAVLDGSLAGSPCHLQWYLAEGNAENIGPWALSAGRSKKARACRPAPALSDNGAAMTAGRDQRRASPGSASFTRTTASLQPVPERPGRNRSGPPFEGRLHRHAGGNCRRSSTPRQSSTRRPRPGSSSEYNRKLPFRESVKAPIRAPFSKVPRVTRQSPDSAALRLAFTRNRAAHPQRQERRHRW